MNTAHAQWIAEYSNNGSGYIGTFPILNSDRYYSGDYLSPNSQQEELLVVNLPNATVKMLSYNYGSHAWTSLYSSPGVNFNGWILRIDDHVTIIRREGLSSLILFTNGGGGWAAAYDFQPVLTTKWTNAGSHYINGWYIREHDKYIAGNFTNQTAGEELLMVSYETGHVALQNFNGSAWQSLHWTSNYVIGSSGWGLQEMDKYTAGDFDNDGIDELLCVNAISGYASLLKYNGSTWTTVRSNGGNLYIGGYHIGWWDRYFSGKVTENNRTELFVVNTDVDNAYLLNYSAGSWNVINGTNDWIGGWNIQSNDEYQLLRNTTHHYLFTSRTTSTWSNLMQYDVAPATPTNFSITTQNVAGENYPKISWSASVEWDVKGNASGYQVWRRIYDGLFWRAYSQIATISGASTQYTDMGTPGAGIGPQTAQYKIRAVDLAGNIGGFSATQNMQFGTNAERSISGPDAAPPKRYIIRSNYPNPFNPSTTITYGLPVNSTVGITIYNVLGQIVASQAPMEQGPGYHQYVFNASTLASGIYYFQLNATPNEEMDGLTMSPVKETHRMFLLK